MLTSFLYFEEISDIKEEEEEVNQMTRVILDIFQQLPTATITSGRDDSISRVHRE